MKERRALQSAATRTSNPVISRFILLLQLNLSKLCTMITSTLSLFSKCEFNPIIQDNKKKTIATVKKQDNLYVWTDKSTL